MGWLLAAAVVAVFAFCIWLPGFFAIKNGNAFEKNKTVGKAEVVGYDRDNESNWYTLRVRIPELGDGKTYQCEAGTGNVTGYPVGSIVDVEYAPVNILGFRTMEVHLLESPPVKEAKLGKGLKLVGEVLFIISLILLAIGIITIII